MIELIIGLSAFLLGGILGAFIGAAKMLFGLLTLLGIPEEHFKMLKKDIKDLAKRVKTTKPETEEEKDKFREEVFNIFTKYSKYALKDIVCVKIAHED